MKALVPLMNLPTRLMLLWLLCMSVWLCCRFEQILLEQDPLPSYALKLMQAYLDNNPAFIRYSPLLTCYLILVVLSKVFLFPNSMPPVPGLQCQRSVLILKFILFYCI